MNKDINNLIKKTAKIAGVTCVAAGAVALMTTGAALKALTTGAQYLKETVQKILEDPAEEIIVDAAPVEEEAVEEVAQTEGCKDTAVVQTGTCQI